MPSATAGKPEIGKPLAVHGQQWAVSEAGESGTPVSMQGVEDGRYGETLEVIWDITLAPEVFSSATLSKATPVEPATVFASVSEVERWHWTVGRGRRCMPSWSSPTGGCCWCPAPTSPSPG